MMKVALLLAFVAAAAAMQGIRPDYKLLNNAGYIARVNENMFRTKAAVERFGHSLEKNYGIEFVKAMDLKTVKFILVKGDHQKVMKLKSLPQIKYVEKNGIVTATQACTSQPASQTWGLDRTDQRETLPYSDPLNPDAMYIWGPKTGASTTVYVTDTGIDLDHYEFEGRASFGWKPDGIPGEDDVNGHGTHCAGTVGGAAFGLAKDTNLVNVKVLGDSGSGLWDWSIDGLAWVVEDHDRRTAEGGATAKSVVSMSLGGGSYPPMDDAVEATVAAGVTVVVAAGNSNGDACNFSPAGAPSAITVGATDVTDWTASFTNWGTCIDIFAPGVSVLSSTPDDNTAVFSGTSMACPHVAGVIARYMDGLPEGPSPADVDAWLKSQGTPDEINWTFGNHGTSPNLLLFGDCEL